MTVFRLYAGIAIILTAPLLIDNLRLRWFHYWSPIVAAKINTRVHQNVVTPPCPVSTQNRILDNSHRTFTLQLQSKFPLQSDASALDNELAAQGFVKSSATARQATLSRSDLFSTYTWTAFWDTDADNRLVNVFGCYDFAFVGP